ARGTAHGGTRDGDDVTGPGARAQRRQGMAEARRKAARMLIDQLVAREERARIAVPDDARLESMVRGIEFVRERPSPGRYAATLNVVFSPEAVKAWLGGSGTRGGETVQRPALVIPLWKGTAGVEPLADRDASADAGPALPTPGRARP